MESSECLSKCSLAYYEYDDLKICVNSCPSEISYYTFVNNTVKHCQSECPKDQPFHLSDNSCTDECTYVLEEEQCEEECPHFYVPQEGSVINKCVTQCPSNMSYADGKKCVEICEDAYQVTTLYGVEVK